MGYQNADMEGDFLQIFIEYENINSATSNGSSSISVEQLHNCHKPSSFNCCCLSCLCFSRNKKEEVAINVDNSSILVPVELLNEEQINSVKRKYHF